MYDISILFEHPPAMNTVWLLSTLTPSNGKMKMVSTTTYEKSCKTKTGGRGVHSVLLNGSYRTLCSVSRIVRLSSCHALLALRRLQHSSSQSLSNQRRMIQLHQVKYCHYIISYLNLTWYKCRYFNLIYTLDREINQLHNNIIIGRVFSRHSLLSYSLLWMG